jgi:hypothetical protein
MNFLHSIDFDIKSRGELPHRIRLNLESFQKSYPEFTHIIYNMEDGRNFIKSNFHNNTIEAFDKIIPLAYKADLLRYCLLYKMGGLYSDLSLNHFFSLPLDDKNKMYVFRDAFSAAPWIVSNSFIYSPAGDNLYIKVINQIIENVLGNYYGHNPLCPTGPNLFGRMLAQHADLSRLLCGEVVRINRTAHHCYGFLDHLGDLVAVNAKRGAGLASLGGNNDDYNQHYRQRNIYKHSSGRKTWTLEELQNRGFVKQINVLNSKPDVMIFGPYVTLGPGSYCATYFLDDNSVESVRNVGVHVDVCAECGNRSIQCTPTLFQSAPEGGVLVSVDFELPKMTPDVEVRLFSSSGLAISEQALEIIEKVTSVSRGAENL